MNRDIYQATTERFVEQLKRGTVPWQKPWFAVQNIVSRKPYRGINSLLLGSAEVKMPVRLAPMQFCTKLHEMAPICRKMRIQTACSFVTLENEKTDSNSLGLAAPRRRRMGRFVQSPL